MTIPAVADGQTIAPTTWGNKVATSINNQAGRFAHILYSPGTVDSPDAFAVWLTPGTVAIPAWATAVRVSTSITYTYPASANFGADWEIRAQLAGAGTGRAIRTRVGANAADVKDIVWNDRVSLSGGQGSTVNFEIATDLVVSTGAIRVDSLSDVCVLLEFEGAEQ